MKKTWKHVSVIRNEVVGHQTLKRTKIESHKIAGMSFEDIRGLFKSCQYLLFRIGSEFQDTHVVFNLKGADSFDNLITDLRSASSFKQAL
ncbi:hypothetical protein [Limnobacter parvus]|uniref:hypothetical protein n=1 Tax=Limnobacter parvus TaxID=2939690 RepID=UPI003530139E